MKATSYIKTILFAMVLIFFCIEIHAQTETANIYKYTPQSGFRKSKLDGKTEFYFKKDKKWVVIDLFDIKASYGNQAEDAQNDWNEIVLKNYTVKGDVVTENHEQDGWQITARTTVTSIIKYNLSLITLTCPGGHASILLTNNDFNNVLDAETGAFIGSLSFVSPAEAVSFIKPVSNPGFTGGGNFPVSGTNPPPPPPPLNYQMPGMNPTQPDPNYQMPGMNNPPPVPENMQAFAPVPGNESPVAPNPYKPPFPTPGEQTVKASIMMDVGWFVEATNDYIQYTKDDIKVIQYFYVAPEDPNSNSPDEDLFWRKYLNQYFSTASYNKYPNDPYDFLTRIEFASCNAVYQPNGHQYFIAWLVDLHNTACSYLAITSSEQVYNSYFPHPNDLGAMNRFNNFPVDIQQIQGKWGESNFSGAQMYEVNTGNYAGMSMASSASSYTFSGNSFSFLTKGATGMVGTAKAFQAEETGTFDINGYNLVTNIASRTDQMTNTTTPKQERVEYSVAFKFAKNTKVLFMQNKQYTGMTYNLVRK
jgi:hypothetical protein